MSFAVCMITQLWVMGASDLHPKIDEFQKQIQNVLLLIKKIFQLFGFLKIYLIYFYFWLHACFLQLQLVWATLPCGAWASHCCGFSCCGARALGTWASVVVAHGFSSCILQALARAQLHHGMWDLPRPGLEPTSPALAGRLLTTAPPGKPKNVLLLI